MINQKELKIILNQQLRSVQTEELTMKRIRSHPLYNFVSNIETSSNTNKVTLPPLPIIQPKRSHSVGPVTNDFINKIIGEKGAGSKYSKTDLEDAGFNFKGFKLNNEFKFFMHTDKSIVS